MITVAVLTDAESGHQAIYVDGDLKHVDDTIYACDIASFVMQKTIEAFSHHVVSLPVGFRFPHEYHEAIKYLES